MRNLILSNSTLFLDEKFAENNQCTTRERFSTGWIYPIEDINKGETFDAMYQRALNNISPLGKQVGLTLRVITTDCASGSDRKRNVNNDATEYLQYKYFLGETETVYTPDAEAFRESVTSSFSAVNDRDDVEELVSYLSVTIERERKLLEAYNEKEANEVVIYDTIGDLYVNTMKSESTNYYDSNSCETTQLNFFVDLESIDYDALMVLVSTGGSSDTYISEIAEMLLIGQDENPEAHELLSNAIEDFYQKWTSFTCTDPEDPTDEEDEILNGYIDEAVAKIKELI